MTDKNKILVADDEDDLRDAVIEGLSTFFSNYTFQGFQDGKQLSERLDQGVHDVALIITDNTMTKGPAGRLGPTGEDIITKYAREDGMPPFILMTADGLGVGSRALKAGAFDYIPKPYSLEQLSRVVSKALGIEK
jgi:DNA-binding NtrC family response regulator